MKKFGCYISTFIMVCLVGAVAYAMTIEIEAHIDGRDQLIINRNTLQWHHFDFAAVGRHAGANSPTIIRTIESGSERGWVWLPDWLVPPPDEIYHVETFSEAFSVLTPEFPTDGVIWRVETLYGRGEVNIIEQPSAGNDFTMVVEFNDNPIVGSSFYGIRLSPNRQYSICCSDDASLTSGELCQDGSFDSIVYVYLGSNTCEAVGEDSIQRVDWSVFDNRNEYLIDDTVIYAPWIFRGGEYPFSVARGYHIAATVHLDNADPEVLEADFEIVEGGPYNLCCSNNASLTSGELCQDGSFNSPVYVYLGSNTCEAAGRDSIARVDFNEPLPRLRERYPPWELRGGEPLTIPGSYHVESDVWIFDLDGLWAVPNLEADFEIVEGGRYNLCCSDNASLTSGEFCQDGSFDSPVYVYLGSDTCEAVGEDSVQRVVFNEPPPTHQERYAPWELLGGESLSAPGSYHVESTVYMDDGDTDTITADFEIVGIYGLKTE